MQVNMIYSEYRPPWEEKLFVLYLLVIVVLAIIRSVSVGRQLWWFSKSRRVIPVRLGSDDPASDSLAKAALANRLSRGPRLEVQSEGNADSQLQLRREADRRFKYAWEICAEKIESTRRNVRLAVLLSVLLLAWNAERLCMSITTTKLFGIAAVSGTLVEMFDLFSLGVLVSAILYAVFGVFDSALARRKIAWNCFSENVENGSNLE